MPALQNVFVLVASVLIFFLLVRWLEKQIVFHPSRYPEGLWQPEVFGVQARDVTFQTTGNLQLHGWYISHPEARGQILMCHGNAGNVGDRLELLSLLHERVPAHLFIFDYRGYGRSDGRPSEKGVYEDAVAAFDWLQRETPDLPIMVHGHSLGAAVAVDLATRRPVDGLLLESPFSNAKDMARLMFGKLPMHWLSSMQWANDVKIKDLRMPKIFLHGSQDVTIPIDLGKKLFHSAPSPKEFVAIDGADHNNLYVADDQAYFSAFSRLLDQSIAHHAMSSSGSEMMRGAAAATTPESK